VQEEYIPPKWSADHKRGDMVISGEGRIITRTDSSGWGTVLSVEVFESGISYHEIKINTNSSDCLYIGVSDANYNDFSSTYNGSFVSFAY